MGRGVRAWGGTPCGNAPPAWGDGFCAQRFGKASHKRASPHGGAALWLVDNIVFLKVYSNPYLDCFSYAQNAPVPPDFLPRNGAFSFRSALSAKRRGNVTPRPHGGRRFGLRCDGCVTGQGSRACSTDYLERFRYVAIKRTLQQWSDARSLRAPAAIFISYIALVLFTVGTFGNTQCSSSSLVLRTNGA